MNFFIGGEDGSGITGLGSGIDVTDAIKASSAIAVIDSAIQYILNEKTKVGAMETRLGYTSDNLAQAGQNAFAVLHLLQA